jgi:hypothetical protein
MHEEPMNQNPALELEAAQLAELEQRLTHALEAAPAVRIPADFAARVARRLPSPLPVRQPVSLTPARYGPTMLVVGIAVLFAALLAVALHAEPHSVVGMTIEWLLFAQFIALTAWFSLRSHREIS